MTISTDRTQMRMALADLAAKAVVTLPAESAGRIACAVKIVLAGDVELLADGTATVASASDPTKVYSGVNGSCPCADFDRAPAQWCKHRIARALTIRLGRVIASTETTSAGITSSVGTVAPTTLPEAPASVNVRVLVQGYEVQWTLRDSDETRLAERLQALLTRPDIRPVPKPAPRSQQWRKGGQHG